MTAVERPRQTDTPLVRLRGIDKSFPGVRALRRVDLDLHAGEVHALTGENGSGKSSLAKVLYGALKPDAGTIEVDCRPVEFSSPAQALALGIVAISQELTLAPTLSVTENVLMGRLPRRRGVVDWPEARELARAALAQLDVDVDETRLVGALSVELQQEVEIARAVSAQARVLVLDEATSSLSEAASAHVLRLIEQLSGRGVAILVISHRLAEIYACASRATVLRDGSRIGVAELPETPEGDLVRMMVGRDLRNLYGRRRMKHGELLLRVDGLATLDGTLSPATFQVKAGEILGIAGLVGSGKGELGYALAGALPSTGEVRIRDEVVSLASPRSAIRSGIGFVPDDRKRSALLPNRSVRENLSAAWHDELTRGRVAINPVAERKMAGAAIQRFNIRTGSQEVPIRTLSGGNQQKAVLARWFMLGLDVLVLSEPTRGVDVGAKSELYDFIHDMADKGSAVIMISSELPELIGVVHRILVMFQGRIVAEFAADSAGEEEIARAALGTQDPTEEQR